MNTIDKIRQKQQAKPLGTTPAKPSGDTPAKPPRQTSGATPKPAEPTVMKPLATVKHSCGHEVPLANLKTRPCPTCRDKNAREKRARKQATNAEKRTQRHDNQRLPHGAAYSKAYDAATTTWTVTLTIPGIPGFTAQGSGSFRTETTVDQLYREWLAAQKPAPAETHLR